MVCVVLKIDMSIWKWTNTNRLRDWSTLLWKSGSVCIRCLRCHAFIKYKSITTCIRQSLLKSPNAQSVWHKWKSLLWHYNVICLHSVNSSLDVGKKDLLEKQCRLSLLMQFFLNKRNELHNVTNATSMNNINLSFFWITNLLVDRRGAKTDIFCSWL